MRDLLVFLLTVLLAAQINASTESEGSSEASEQMEIDMMAEHYLAILDRMFSKMGRAAFGDTATMMAFIPVQISKSF